jgi:hypothetical protein
MKPHDATWKDRLKLLVVNSIRAEERQGRKPRLSMIARSLRLSYAVIASVHRELVAEGRCRPIKSGELSGMTPDERREIARRLGLVRAAKLEQYKLIGEWLGLDEARLQEILP